MTQNLVTASQEENRKDWGPGPPTLEGYASPNAEPAAVGYLRLLLQHKIFLAAAAILGAVGALGFMLLTPPRYESVATIEVQSRNENFLNMREVDQTAPGPSFNWEFEVAARLAELKSRSLAERVIEALDLDNDPDFGGGVGNETWRSELKRFLLPASPPPTRREAALEMLFNEVKIETAPRTGTIYISVTDSRSNRAAAIANAYVKQYTTEKSEAHSGNLGSTQELLARQLIKLKETLRESEQRLQAYAADHSIAFTGHDESAQGTNLKQLQAKLAEAQWDLASKNSKLATAEASSAAKLVDITDNPILQKLEISLSELKSQQADILTTADTSNPRAEAISRRIAAVERSLTSERRNTLDRIQKDYTTAFSRVHILSDTVQQQEKRVTEQGADVVEYNTLKSEVESNQALYRTFFQKANDAGLAATLSLSDIRVIDPARSNHIPVRRNLIMNMIAGIISGLTLAGTFVLARAGLDRTLRSGDEASRILPVITLGAIPLLPRRVRSSLSRGGRATWESDMRVADSFRAAATSILFTSESPETPMAIAVTSPEPGDGKTTVVVNLGAALGESGRRTVLLDLDLRQPTLHRALGVRNEDGIAEYLCDPQISDPKDLIRSTAFPGVFVITAGRPDSRFPGLLTSPRLPQLLDSLRRMFDVVIVDSPPLIVADARRVAHAAGRALLVLRASRTQRDQAAAACALLARDRTSVLGAIVNACPEATRSYQVYPAYLRA